MHDSDRPDRSPKPVRGPRRTLPRRSIEESIYALEPRYLFDAAGVAGVATGAEAAAEQLARALLLTREPVQQRNEIVFIDPSVEDYATLVSGIGSGVEVVILDRTADGIAQIASALEGREGLDAVHIITLGTQAGLDIGTGVLDVDSMGTAEQAAQLATIGAALEDGGDILFYGCNFGRGDAGRAAAEQLAALTGADVAASSDDTGHASLGGDWALEVNAGEVETDTV